MLTLIAAHENTWAKALQEGKTVKVKIEPLCEGTNISPENAKKVILQAEFVPEGDVCTFLYDYINMNDETHWFENESAIASSKLMDYLIELKNII